MNSGHLNIDFKIRLPQELKEKIRHSAEVQNRTMTADIVARLEETFINQKKTMSIASSLILMGLRQELINSGKLTEEEFDEVFAKASVNSIKPEFVQKYYTLESEIKNPL